jgi:hypothetical protein
MSLKIIDVKHLAATRDFADAQGLRPQFEEKLAWLEKFRDGTCECVLYPDHSPHSFYFELMIDGQRLMNGGLIYYDYGDTGVGLPQCSVRLDDTRRGWEIHT